MPQLEQIEAIEKRLWSSADNLRANSNYASNEYFMPVMGLIFLHHALRIGEKPHHHSISQNESGGAWTGRQYSESDGQSERFLKLVGDYLETTVRETAKTEEPLNDATLSDVITARCSSH
jgi:hypothetical protein